MLARGDHDLLHTGRAGGDGAHHDRGRIRVAPGRDVDRRPPHRHLAQPHGVPLGQLRLGLGVQPGLGHAANVRHGDLEPPADIGIEPRQRGGELLGSHPQRLAAAAEALLERDQRPVAAGPHGGHDLAHVVRHRGARRHQRAHPGGRLGRVRDAAAQPLSRHGSAPLRHRSPPP